MKNTIKFLLAMIFGLMLFSCRNDDAKAIYNGSGTNSLTADAASLVLTKANAASKAVTFTWTNPNNGFNGQINNVLQVALAGTNFANPVKVALPVNTTSITYTVQDLNTILLKLGLPFTSASNVEFRVVSIPTQDDPASVNAVAATYSNVVKMTVTPFPLTAYMYMPGAYQNWDPTTANTMVSQTGNGVYVGFINFPAAASEFKITADRSWATNYGTPDGATLKSGGDNIKSPGAGYYKITVDMNKNTIKMVPYSMGIVGDVNNWTAPDLAMTWNDSLLSWTYTGNFVAGGFKFRVNNDWAENYGGANGVITTDNITVAAGTHTVKFNPFAMTYSVQ